MATPKRTRKRSAAAAPRRKSETAQLRADLEALAARVETLEAERAQAVEPEAATNGADHANGGGKRSLIDHARGMISAIAQTRPSTVN